jgi:hypothetical protein
MSVTGDAMMPSDQMEAVRATRLHQATTQTTSQRVRLQGRESYQSPEDSEAEDSESPKGHAPARELNHLLAIAMAMLHAIVDSRDGDFDRPPDDGAGKLRVHRGMEPEKE